MAGKSITAKERYEAVERLAWSAAQGVGCSLTPRERDDLIAAGIMKQTRRGWLLTSKARALLGGPRP